MCSVQSWGRTEGEGDIIARLQVLGDLLVWLVGCLA